MWPKAVWYIHFFNKFPNFYWLQQLHTQVCLLRLKQIHMQCICTVLFSSSLITATVARIYPDKCFLHGRQYRFSANHFFTFIFLYENGWILIPISLKSIQKYATIGSDNGLVSNGQQANIWTNDCMSYWRVDPSVSLVELRICTKWPTLLKRHF